MTTGPPPKITVPARYRLAKRSRTSGGVASWLLATRIPIKETNGINVNSQKICQVEWVHTKKETHDQKSDPNANDIML